MCGETCQTCNRDRTICATNVGYGYEFEENGFNDISFSTFRYNSDTDNSINVTTIFNVDYSTGGTCSVSVNGERCRSCGWASCTNGFAGFKVLCDNIEGVGNYQPCSMAYEDVSVPLNIFAFQDPFFRDGCEPILWTPSTY